MAKKPYKHTELSNVECSQKGCRKRIKLNLTTRKPDQASFKCYRHYMQDVQLKRNKRK